MNIKNILISIVLTLVVHTISAQNVPDFITDSLDAYVLKEMSGWKIPGVGICIVKNGQVQVMKTYGVREHGKTEKIDKNTLFFIGSNTKAFAATALTMSAFENNLSMDEKVIKWIPNFQLKDKFNGDNATFADILSHRMGYETFQGDFMFLDSDLSENEILDKFKSIEPKHPFRTTWGYCNTGYFLAGICINNISGMHWVDYVKKNIFTPLEMQRSSAYCCDMPQSINRAQAHTVINNEIVQVDYSIFDNMGPAGCISSSLEDMSHWVIALLNNGKYKNKQVIPENVINETWKPTSIVGKSRYPKGSNFLLYGLGWFIQDYNGKEIIWHTGGTTGFVTSVTLVPEEKLGIIIFTNTDHGEFYEAIKWDIVNIYLGLPFQDYSSGFRQGFNYRQKLKDQKTKALMDSVKMKLPGTYDLKHYTGTYTHSIYGKIFIEKQNDHLIIKFEHQPDLIATLERIDGERFLTTYNKPIYGINVLEFQSNKNGRILLPLKVNDFIERDTYYFEKQKY